MKNLKRNKWKKNLYLTLDFLIVILYICIMKTYIYTLEHPITNEIRYVGKTNSPERRLHHHWTVGYKSNNKTGNWLKSLKKLNLKPLMTIIDETEGNWQDLESYWISQFRTWGFNLTNHTNGGEGVYGGGEWNNTPVTVFTKEGILFKSFDSQKQCASYFKTTPGIVKSVVSGRTILLLKKYQVKLGIISENIDKAKERKPYKLSENKIPITEEKLIIAEKMIKEGNSFRKTAIAINTNHTTLIKYLKNYENRKGVHSI